MERWAFQRMLPGIKLATGASPTELDDFHRILDDDSARLARQRLEAQGQEWDEERGCWRDLPEWKEPPVPQLALIPNTKNCVKEAQQGGLFDGRDDDST